MGDPVVPDPTGLYADMELFDIKDQAEVVGYLTPIEYAKLRNMSSQLVYYYIRNKTIEVEPCRCGRSVVSVSQADAALQAKKVARGKVLDTSSDAERGPGDDLQDLSQEDPVEGS